MYPFFILRSSTSPTEFDSGAVIEHRECKPRPALFSLSHLSASDIPSYVELYRCMSYEMKYLTNYRFVNISTNKVTTIVGSEEVISFNHTQCAMSCVCQEGTYSLGDLIKDNKYGTSVVSLKLFVFALIGELVLIAKISYCVHNSKVKEGREDQITINPDSIFMQYRNCCENLSSDELSINRQRKSSLLHLIDIRQGNSLMHNNFSSRP